MLSFRTTSHSIAVGLGDGLTGLAWLHRVGRYDIIASVDDGLDQFSLCAQTRTFGSGVQHQSWTCRTKQIRILWKAHAVQLVAKRYIQLRLWLRY